MSENEYFDEVVLPKVIANEKTARMLLERLKERGCEFSKPIESLTFEECRNAIIRIYAYLEVKESK